MSLHSHPHHQHHTHNWQTCYQCGVEYCYCGEERRMYLRTYPWTYPYRYPDFNPYPTMCSSH